MNRGNFHTAIVDAGGASMNLNFLSTPASHEVAIRLNSELFAREPPRYLFPVYWHIFYTPVNCSARKGHALSSGGFAPICTRTKPLVFCTTVKISRRRRHGQLDLCAHAPRGSCANLHFKGDERNARRSAAHRCLLSTPAGLL